MGTRHSASDAAPAYEELFEGHDRPANTLSGYTLVAQTEETNHTHSSHDLEQNYHHTHHSPLSPASNAAMAAGNANANASTGAGTMTIAIDNLPAPESEHIHCEACDRLIERRQRRHNQRHCCTMVAVTFIVAFFCLMVLGVVMVRAK